MTFVLPSSGAMYSQTICPLSETSKTRPNLVEAIRVLPLDSL